MAFEVIGILIEVIINMLLFSKRLKEIRINSGLTQQQLGDMVGVTKVSVCCYEKGTRTPTLDKLMDIADALHVEFTYLLGNDSYVVADDDEEYGMNIAKDELKLIRTLRNYHELYEMMISDPDRMMKLIEQKIR